MEVKIKVPETLIRQAVYDMVDQKFYEEYDEEFLAQANFPKRVTLVKKIMTDPNFLSALEKLLTKPASVKEYLGEFIFDELEYLKVPVINDLEHHITEAYNEYQVEERRQEQEVLKSLLDAQQANDLGEMISLLESKGYTVVKDNSWQDIRSAI